MRPVSVWDDSWGHAQKTVTFSHNAQVSGGILESGTARCAHTRPSLTTGPSLDSAEENTVAPVTILRPCVCAQPARPGILRTPDLGRR